MRLPRKAKGDKPMLVAGQKKLVITGGAGFIGSNLANRLISEGQHVTIFDMPNEFGVATR